MVVEFHCLSIRHLRVAAYVFRSMRFGAFQLPEFPCVHYFSRLGLLFLWALFIVLFRCQIT